MEASCGQENSAGVGAPANSGIQAGDPVLLCLDTFLCHERRHMPLPHPTVPSCPKMGMRRRGWPIAAFAGHWMARGNGLCMAGVFPGEDSRFLERRRTSLKKASGLWSAALRFGGCHGRFCLPDSGLGGAGVGLALGPWSGCCGGDCGWPGGVARPGPFGNGSFRVRSGCRGMAQERRFLPAPRVVLGGRAVAGRSVAAAKAALWETPAPAAGPMRPRAQSVPQGGKPPIRKTGAERRALTPRWSVR